MTDNAHMFWRSVFTASIITILALLAMSAHADEHYGNFFTTQPKQEAAFDAIWLLDMAQTLDLCEHEHSGGPTGLGYHEMNPMLGSYPSRGKIVGYFAAGAALHAAITYEMVSQDVPRPVINAWEYVTIGVEAATVGSNYHFGLRFKFQ